MTHWKPSCLGALNNSNAKYRMLSDGIWFYIESKTENDEKWQGGLAGTQEWLGVSDEECSRAYKKKG